MTARFNLLSASLVAAGLSLWAGGARAAEITINPGPVGKFVPPRVAGDAEFGGNGPDVHARVELKVADGKLIAVVYMHAKETRGDRTEVKGSTEYVIPVLVDGKPRKVVRLGNGQEAVSEWKYTDTNHADDKDPRAAPDLVKLYTVVGDTKGKEAGTRTGVTVEFNAIRVVVE